MDEFIHLLDLHDQFGIINLRSLSIHTISKHVFKNANDALTTLNCIQKEPSYLQSCTPTIVKRVSPTIITSFKCNYACEYCFEKSSTHSSSVLLESDIAKIREFYIRMETEENQQYLFESINIMGGEPLLTENYNTICTIFDTWPNTTIKITTNGYNLLYYRELFVRNRNRIKLKISLDGVESVHFSKRKTSLPNAYERTIEGIKTLLHDGVRIQIITMFNPAIPAYQYSLFFDLLDSLGWRKDTNLSVGFIGQFGCGYDDMNIEEIVQRLEQFVELKQHDSRTRQVDAKRLIPGTYCLLESLKLAKKGEYSPYRCKCLQNPSYTFLPDGTVHICLMVPHLQSVIGRYKPSFDFDMQIVKEYGRRRIDLLDPCKQCYASALCRGGCAATAVSKTGSVSGLYCNLWKNPVFLKFFEQVL